MAYIVRVYSYGRYSYGLQVEHQAARRRGAHGFGLPKLPGQTGTYRGAKAAEGVHSLRADIAVAEIVMAYIVMACIVMAYIVMAYIVMAYIVMAWVRLAIKYKSRKEG